MAENEGNNADPGNNDDSKQDTPPAPRTLDEVHEQALRQFDDESATDKDDDNDEGDDDNKSDDSQDDDDKPVDGDGADDDTQDTDESDDEDPPKPAADDEEELEDPEPPEKMDEDISKPGKYKAKFVDVDGKEYHVTSLDQLPDDYEPRNRKEELKSLQELNNKQTEARQDTERYQQEQAEVERQRSVKRLNDSWKQSIETLTASKKLPADKAERDKVVKGIFDLMDAELKNGRVIDNFEHAHEIYQYRQSLIEQEDQRKQQNQQKKDKGAKVFGGRSPSGQPKPKSGQQAGTRVLQAPPRGLTLDDIHQRTLGSL